MERPPRFEIRLAKEAEAGLLALPPSEREHLKSVVEGIAELAALAPPSFPAWFRRRGMEVPLMRMTVADLRIEYELNTDDHSLRVCGIEDLTRNLQQAAEVIPITQRRSRLSFL
jgi:mRNA-degrading endonuclease RelE of RelBE toxin-antitoxin system